MSTPDHYKKIYFKQRKSEIKNLESLEKIVEEANDNYSKDDTVTRFKVAYSYKAAAEYLKDFRNSHLKRASRLFHFAGHHLRKLEEWRNAGIAYQQGGETAMEAKDFEWAIRSFARAKRCFEDVGEAEEAANAYVLEQDARLMDARKKKILQRIIILTAWRWTSLYGQKWSKWAFWLIGILLGFSGIYEILFNQDLILMEYGGKVPIFRGFYLTVRIITTLGFTEIKVANIFAQAIVIINLILGWMILGIGAAMIARRVKQR